MLYAPDPRGIGFLVLYVLAVCGASWCFDWSAGAILVSSLLIFVALAILASVVAAVLQIISWITGKDFGLDD
jgi:hypothetical protein